MSRRPCLRGVILILCVGFLAGNVAAQILTGSIGGTVTDSSGAVIAGAKITVTSPNLIGGAKTVESDENGTYRFLELPPGTYTVSFEKTGFKSLTQRNIVLNTGVQVTADAKLDPGNVSETVTVEANAATIDLEHVTQSSVANQAIMEDIPNGRSPWAIGNSVPSITTTTFDVGGSAGMQQAALLAHGSNTADQKFMIDGISVNWPGGGGGSTLMYYDMGMFQEVNYLVGALPADVSQGGVYMNMVTKDGGNQFNGRIFANGAPDSFQSNNVDAALANKLYNNLSASTKAKVPFNNVVFGNPITDTYDFNGQAGGPIIKDKLWFFTSWRLWATNNLYPGSFNHDGTQALNDNQIADEMGKFSYQANAKNRFSVMYFRNQKNRYHRRNQGNFGDDFTTVLQNQPGYEADFKWTFVPSNRWVIDAGFALTSGKTPYRYQNAAPAGAISVYDTSTTEVFNIAQYTYLNPMYRAALDASASYFASNWAGTHNFKFGYQHYQDDFEQRYIANGDIQGQAINGVPSTALLYNTPIDIQKNNGQVLALYAEDTWNIKRNFTLSYGVRWERWVGWIPHETSAAGTYVAARDYPEVHGCDSNAKALNRCLPDWRNWTPRLGFSWNVLGNGKTVVKGSVSKYMQGEGLGNLVASLNPLGFSTGSVTWTCPGGGANPNNVPSIAAANAACIARGPQPSELALSSFSGFSGGLTTHMDPALKRPFSWEYSFGVQQELPYNVILSVMGWYRKVYDQIGEINLAVPSSAYTPITITNPIDGKPLTIYNQSAATKGQVNYLLINSPALNQYYRGIDINFSRRMTGKWMLVGGVTYGRNNGAFYGDVNSGPGLNDLNNPNVNINRQGVLLNDAPVIFKLGGTYNLPWGVVLAGNFQHVTGYPERATYTVTSAIAGQTLTQNTQNVEVEAPGYKRLPNVNLLDVRFSRIFTFHERYRLEPEFDFYNLTNASTITSVNNSVNAVISGTTYVPGTIGSLYLNPINILPPRLFKLGLRFDF